MAGFRNIRGVARVLCLVGILAGAGETIPPASLEAQETPGDLPALLIHPDDLDWIVEEQELQGQLEDAPYITDISLYFTTVDEVLASPYYLWGRGGFLPSAMDPDGDLLEDAGWQRTVDAFMVRQSSMDGMWITGIGVSVEEYETARGAGIAFEAFNDAGSLAEVALATDAQPLDAPDLGDEATMWALESEYVGAPAIPVIALWVRVDTFIVSIAAYDASEISEPDPDVVIRMMELQLKRLEHARHLVQPHLSACAPRLAGENVRTLSDDYSLLNGTSFGGFDATYATIAEDAEMAARYGMVHRHRLRQEISGTESGVTDGNLYYTVYTRAFVDEDRAAGYMDDLDRVLEEEERDQAAELDDVPGMAEAARTFTYVGSSGSPSTVTYVQLGPMVYSVYLGPSSEPMPEAVHDLAAASLDRLDSGNCAVPIDVPEGL